MARVVEGLRTDARSERRIDERAAKNAAGQVSEEKLAEYASCVPAMDFITIL